MASDVKGKSKGFVWNEQLHRYFLSLLVDYQRHIGKGQAYSWLDLTATFEETTKVKCGKDTLKNKYGNIKDKFKLWKLMKHGETGLGWDEARHTVAATDEWWKRKLQENNAYKQFRRRGIPPDVEEQLEVIYGGTLANGDLCVSPSMTVAPTPGLHQNKDASAYTHVTQTHNTEADDVVDGEEDDLLMELPSQRVDGATESAPAGGYLHSLLDGLEDLTVVPNSGPAAPTSAPTNRKRSGTSTTTRSQPKKRSARQSVGSTLYQEQALANIESNRAMVSLWKSTESSDATAESMLVNSKTNAMKLITNMVEEGLLPRASQLWCFAVSLMTKTDKGDIFLLIPTSKERREWIKWEFIKSGETDPDI